MKWEIISFPKPQKERKEEDAPWDRSTYTIAPSNLSDLGPRDTVCIPIHRSDDLTVLFLFFRLIVPVGLKLYRF